ncbi:MAG: TolC family protein, partial [Deltaproteobacteria bacterium]|nr:TolC family protein [Deltaproteobacteria bacterium]
YLLLDFGGRSAKAEAARQALIAANWNHNQAIQDLLRDVPKAYYTYVGDLSKVTASETNLREARTTLAATEERKSTGVGTIVDVLQAKANKASVEVELVSNKGAAKIAKGSLATTVGWPANTPFKLANAPQKIPLNKLGSNVDDLITDAKRNRAAIASSKASVKQKEAELLEARTLPFPKVTGGGNTTWERMRRNDSIAYYGTFNVEIPIFKGFEMRNSIREARASLAAARAQLKLEEEQIIQEVWNAYNNFKTASEQLSASNTLLRSSKESYDASLARYRKGAADIVELLNSQTLLASARSQVIDSKMGLYISYAELIHAVGSQMDERFAPQVTIEEEDLGNENN